MLEQPRPLHGEIGTVELQEQAPAVDQLVLLAHLAGEREDIALVGVVVGVQVDGGDDAGGGRGQEALGERRRVRVGVPEQAIAFPRRLAQVDVGDLVHRLRGVTDAGRRAPPGRQQRAVIREVREVPGERAPALATEPPHAPGHVGGEAGAGLLAVVADVDPDLELPLDGHLDGRLDLPVEQGGVHGLAALLADQEVTQDGVAGQAAHVGHEDALVTRDRLDPHRHCLPAPSFAISSRAQACWCEE